MWVGSQRHTPADLPTAKRSGFHFVRSCGRPRADLDRCGISRHHLESIPGPFSRRCRYIDAIYICTFTNNLILLQICLLKLYGIFTSSKNSLVIYLHVE